MVHDGDAITDCLRLLHRVCREKDAAPLFSEPLDSVPELAPRLGVDVSDHYVPSRRTQETFDSTQRAGLARTVGTQKSVDLPLANVEIDAVNGDDWTVGNA